MDCKYNRRCTRRVNIENIRFPERVTNEIEDAVSPIYVPMDDGGMDMFKDIDNFDVEALEQAAQ